MTNFTTSLGQGNSCSKSHHALNDFNLSIIKRLAYRSLCGQPLHIQIHQHFGYRIHLTWTRLGRERKEERRAIEGAFLMEEEAGNFCYQLVKGGLDGISACIASQWTSSFYYIKPILVTTHRITQMLFLVNLCV
jgi:hypothetical protein